MKVIKQGISKTARCQGKQQAPHRHSKHSRNLTRVQCGRRRSIRVEPDFDALNLDEDYYKEIGLSKEEAMDQLEDVLNVDPMNDPDLDFGDSDDEDDDEYEPDYSVSDAPTAKQKGRGQTIDTTLLEPAPYGPPAAVLAGFREHELGMVRAMFDEAGAYELKVIPCRRGMLYGTVGEAIQASEPEWDKPRAFLEDLGGANYGSKRTILFSGLSQNDILAALTLMEYSGMPKVLVCTASPENSATVLGQVLAETVQKEQRRPRQVDLDFSETFEDHIDGQPGFSSASPSRASRTESSRTAETSTPNRIHQTGAQSRPGISEWGRGVASTKASSDIQPDLSQKSAAGCSPAQKRSWKAASSEGIIEDEDIEEYLEEATTASPAIQPGKERIQEAMLTQAETSVSQEMANGMSQSQTYSSLGSALSQSQTPSNAEPRGVALESVKLRKSGPAGMNQRGISQRAKSALGVKGGLNSRLRSPLSPKSLRTAANQSQQASSSQKPSSPEVSMLKTDQQKPYLGMSLSERLRAQRDPSEDANGKSLNAKQSKFVFSRNRNPGAGAGLTAGLDGRYTGGLAFKGRGSKLNPSTAAANQPESKPLSGPNSAYLNRWGSESSQAPAQRDTRPSPDSQNSTPSLDRLSSRPQPETLNSRHLAGDSEEGLQSEPQPVQQKPTDLPPVSPIGFSPTLKGWSQQARKQPPKSSTQDIVREDVWDRARSQPLEEPSRRAFQHAEFQDSVSRFEAPDSQISSRMNGASNANFSTQSTESQGSAHQPIQQTENPARTARETMSSPQRADSQPTGVNAQDTAKGGSGLDDSKARFASNKTKDGSLEAEQPEERPALWHQNANSAEMMEEVEAALPGTAAMFGGSIQTHESAEEERALRREAAEEMQRRAKLAQNNGDQEAYQEALNMIDAVAAGEDLDTMLKLGSSKKKESIKDVVEAQSAENRRKMEEVLNKLRAGAAILPEEEQKKLNRQVKILENDKDNISKVLAQLGASLDSVPEDDRQELESQLKREAWDPTKDAIGAALACGISAEELKEMVTKAAADKQANRGEWYPSVAQASQKDLEQFK